MSPARPALPALALLLAALTGAAGLCLEALWVRSLGLHVGGPLAAFATVVTSFMLGLSLGAVTLGRLSDRLARPLALFGFAQIGVGLLGAASLNAGALIRRTLAAAGQHPGDPSFLVVEAVVACALYAVPAFLMGGTLPLLLAAHPTDLQARSCGRLAAANAAGAAAGALIAGFVLLPAFGLRRSLLVASATSLVAGLAGLAASTARTGPAGRGESTGHAPAGAGVPAIVVLIVSGAALTALELVWARLAMLTFGSTAQAGSLVLAAVIGGIAAGNLLGSRVRDDAAGWLGALALAAGTATLLSAPLLGRMPVIAAWGATALGRPMEDLLGAGHAVRLAVMTLVTAIPCVLIGAIFPVAFRMLAKEATPSPGAAPRSLRGAGAAAGAASAAASLGNLAGAPAAYLALTTPAGSREIALACAVALCACGIAAPRAAMRAGAIVLTSIAAAVLWLGPPWDPARLSAGPFLYGALYRGGGAGTWEGILDAIEDRGTVIFSEEGPHALVTVRRDVAGHLSMQVNGKTDASTAGDMRTQTLLAQIPMLVHASSRPAPANSMLVVGLGSGVSAGTALGHPLRTLTILEISPEVAAAETHFAEANHHVRDDPRSRLVIGDARSWLLFDDGVYDVIASQPSNPWVAGEASLFTREFFDLSRARLAPGGIVCQWIQGYGLDPEDFRSVVATFTSVFPHASLWEESTTGGDYLLLGSEDPMAIDPERLRAAMASGRVAEDLARIEVLSPADLLSLRVSSGDPLAGYAAGAPLQTEDRLALEFTAPAALHRETTGAILAALEPVRLPPSQILEHGVRRPHDAVLARELLDRARAAAEQRAFAADFGLDRIRPIDARMHRAIGYLRAGMKSHARSTLTAIARDRADDPLPRLLLAHIAMSAGDTAAAVTFLGAAAALEPGSAAVHLHLSRALFAAGRTGEALDHNTEAIRLAPERADAPSDRCAIFLRLGDEPSAEAACRDALAFDPQLAPAHANLGLLHARRGRDAEAEASYLRALSLSPSLEDARFNLAILYERQGRGAEGLDVVAPLLSGSPGDGDLLRLAARLAIAAGDFALAARSVEQSLALDPGNDESLDLARRLRLERKEERDRDPARFPG